MVLKELVETIETRNKCNKDSVCCAYTLLSSYYKYYEAGCEICPFCDYLAEEFDDTIDYEATCQRFLLMGIQ